MLDRYNISSKTSSKRSKTLTEKSPGEASTWHPPPLLWGRLPLPFQPPRPPIAAPQLKGARKNSSRLFSSRRPFLLHLFQVVPSCRHRLSKAGTFGGRGSPDWRRRPRTVTNSAPAAAGTWGGRRRGRRRSRKKKGAPVATDETDSLYMQERKFELRKRERGGGFPPCLLLVPHTLTLHHHPQNSVILLPPPFLLHVRIGAAYGKQWLCRSNCLAH